MSTWLFFYFNTESFIKTLNSSTLLSSENRSVELIKNFFLRYLLPWDLFVIIKLYRYCRLLSVHKKCHGMWQRNNINFKPLNFFFYYKIVPVQTFLHFSFTNWAPFFKKPRVPQFVPHIVPQLNTFKYT